MSEITLVRMHDIAMPEADKAAARRVLLGALDGLGEDGRKSWRRLLGMLFKMEPGEMTTIRTNKSRSGPFHRRHFLIEQTVFDAQERFEHFEQYLYWVKVGAGWVTWAAGPKGGVVPIPRSISYAEADEVDFRQFHDQVIQFLRGPHAARYLWPHLGDKADEMMNVTLEEFSE